MICLKIRTFVVSATTCKLRGKVTPSCDLLENSYLCGISNNTHIFWHTLRSVVICLKIRTFVVSATTCTRKQHLYTVLWFAWKFVPLWYQQQRLPSAPTTLLGCDLLENSYLCGISNNPSGWPLPPIWVVICLKIRTFVVSATTCPHVGYIYDELWFAWKFVPLWYQQQRSTSSIWSCTCCDLLENSYLCGISNNQRMQLDLMHQVVICLKIRTFVVSATTINTNVWVWSRLWFAWKFVPLWYQQQQESW